MQRLARLFELRVFEACAPSMPAIIAATMTVDTASPGGESTRFRAFADASVDDPYPAYRSAREAGGVHRDNEGRYYFFRYHDVARLLPDPECPHWDDEPVPARNYVGACVRRYDPKSPPEYHRRARRMLRRRARISEQELTELAAEILADVLPKLRAGAAVDLMRDYVRPFMFRAASETLGLPETERQRAWLAIDAYPHPVVTLLPAALGRNEGGLVANVLITALERTLQHRRTQRGDDLASVAWDAWDAGERPDRVSEVDQLLFSIYAAFETGAGFLGNAICALLRNPRALAKTEGGVDGRMTHELLRFVGPIQFIRVGNREPIMLDAAPDRDPVEIPAGSEVFLGVAAANRDPALCDRPDELDLDREPVRHVAFGRGPLRCVGANLGALQGRVGLQSLLQACPDLELIPEQPPQWKWEAVLMRGPRTLPVRLRPAQRA